MHNHNHWFRACFGTNSGRARSFDHGSSTYTPHRAHHRIITITRASDGAFIPTDPDNMDYVAFLAWCDEGNEPTPYTPPEAAK